MNDSCGPCANECPPGQSELTPTQAEGLFDLASVSAADRESQPTPGELQRSFPHFEILEMLGRGGMGVVYKARQITLDRFVAIKLLPPALGDDPDFAHRFQREARAMARLSHPGIITLHDFGQTPEGQLYFVMEFVDGANLHDLIKSGGLAPADALSIAAQVCEALAYAHGEGVVHRDIKPANVMVTHCGRVKVADFGLARLIGQENPSELTMTGTVMGTLHYMAPEQRRGEHVDHRADIFALGVMLYEMLCREVPHGMFDLPSTRVGCDPRIDHIVARAMQNELERRFQSTQEMHAAIESARTAILVPVPVAPRVPALVPPKPPAFAKPVAPLALPPAARSRARAYTMLAVALIALACGAWWLVHARTRGDPGEKAGVRPGSAGVEAQAKTVSASWHPPPGPPGLVKTFDFSHVRDIALVQGDRRLLLLDEHQWLRLVDLASGQTLWHAAVAGGRLDVASDDLRVICSGMSDGTTLRADSIDAEGKTVAQWSTPYPRIASGYTLSTAASPDGTLLCLAIQERRVQDGERTAVVVHVLATETLKSVAEWQVRPVSMIYSVAWLDAHRFLLSAKQNGDLLAFDLARPADPPRPHPAQLHFTVGADPSGQFLAGSYAGMPLAISSVRDGFKPMKLREKGVSRVLHFVGTRQLIALDMNGHDLSLFDVQSGTLAHEFHFEDDMDQLAVSRDGTFAVMRGGKEGGNNRNYAALWRLREIR